MKGLWLIALIGLLSCTRSGKMPLAAKELPPSPVVASASVDKALISTEDSVTFSVTVNREANIDAPIPDIGSLIQGFRITDFGTDEKEEDKRKITRKWFSLRADVAGSYVLPEVAVTYHEGTEEKTAKTSEIFVEVKATAAPEGGDQAAGAPEDIRDIKEMVRTPFPWFAWGGGGLGLLVLGGLGYFFYRRRKKTPEHGVRLLPHEEAFQRLEALELPDGSDPVALKRYYFLLSEIIRSYVENRYGFRATDMTSEEIVRNLRTNGSLPETEKPVFIEFIKETDFVKFADHAPSAEAIVQAKERVKTFVAQTQPPVAQTEAVV